MTGGKAGLPISAKIVVAAWATTGTVALVIAAQRLWVTGWPGGTALMFAVVFGTLMAASWVWPIMLHIDDQPDAFDLDEGFFVLLVMLVPAALTVLVFAVVAVVAQAVKRRPLVKSVFNVGQVVTSAGIGALAFVLVHGSDHSDGYLKVGAALVGAVCYLVVNTGAIASILASLGTPWREAVFDGIEGRLLVAAGAIGIAIPTALLLASQPKFLPLAVLPLLRPALPGGGALLRPERPDAAARPVRRHAGRQPLHRQRPDACRRAQFRRLAAALARCLARPRATRTRGQHSVCTGRAGRPQALVVRLGPQPYRALR